ncbi:MAG: hypothetical protein OXF79_16410 [Chloroflexi bacterium]|nr:hypothetical protein [Chloroflexota bacterium]
MGQRLTAAEPWTSAPLHTALPGYFRRQRDHRAAYACERACSCRQRARYGCAAGSSTPEVDDDGLETVYRQRVLSHAVGNMMLVARLRDSSFFGATNADIHDAAVAAPTITEPATWRIREYRDAPAAIDGSAVHYRIVRRQVSVADDSACAEQAVAAAEGAGVMLTSLTGGIEHTVQVKANHVNGHSDWSSATATLNQAHGATRVRRAGPAPPAISTLRRQSDLLGHPRCV